MEQLTLRTPSLPMRRAFSLRDTLLPVFRHKRMFTLSFLGIFLGAVLAVTLLPRQYESQMKILVQHERLDPVVSVDATAPSPIAIPPVSDDEINSEIDLLQERDVLEKVVLDNGLQNRRSLLSFLESKDEPTRIAEAVKRLGDKLEVKQVSRTDLIQVSYDAYDPQLAFHVLASLADAYLQKHLSVHRPSGALQFFQKESDQYHQGLEDAEARLAEFGKNEKVVSAQVQGDLALQKLSEFQASLYETQAEIRATQNRINELEAQVKSTPDRVNTTQMLADNGQVLQMLQATLTTLELKQSDMAAHFAPDYRPLKELESQIEQTKEKIAEVNKAPIRQNTTDMNPTYNWLAEELARSRTDLASLKAREAGIAANVDLYQQKAQTLGTREIEQQDLTRTVKEQEANYLLYQNKMEEARISDALDRKRIMNVALAQEPNVPVLPAHSALLLVSLGFFMAGCVSTGIAFAADYMDPSLRTADEVYNVLELPVLAALPERTRPVA
jgi:uncharacterized protein involved in exopolysaccharide biosynthesis